MYLCPISTQDTPAFSRHGTFALFLFTVARGYEALPYPLIGPVKMPVFSFASYGMWHAAASQGAVAKIRPPTYMV